MSQREQMLNDIGVVSFAVVDLMQYLDTHPTDCDALEYFNHYNKIQSQLEKEFAQKYYPLKAEYAECEQEWKWGMAPLPWEGVCG